MSDIHPIDVSPYVAAAAERARNSAMPLHPVVAHVLRRIVPDRYLPPTPAPAPDALLTGELYLVSTLDDGIGAYPTRAAAIEAMAATFETLRVVHVAPDGARKDISAFIAPDYADRLRRDGLDIEAILRDSFVGMHLTNDEVDRICDPDGWVG